MNARELNLHHTTSTCTARPLVVRADIPLPTLQIQSCRRASHSNDSNRATVLIEEVDVDIGVEVKVLSRSTAMRYRVWYVNVRRQVGSSYSMLSARPLNTRSRGSATVPHAAARLGTIAVIKRGGKCRGLDGSSQPPTGSRHRSGTHTVGWTSTSARLLSHHLPAARAALRGPVRPVLGPAGAAAAAAAAASRARALEDDVMVGDR